jgi:hypothetical protein
LAELIGSKGLGDQLRLFVDLKMLPHLMQIHFAFGIASNVLTGNDGGSTRIHPVANGLARMN